MAVHWDPERPRVDFVFDMRAHQPVSVSSSTPLAPYFAPNDLSHGQPTDYLAPAAFSAPAVFESGEFANRGIGYRRQRYDQPGAYWINNGNGLATSDYVSYDSGTFRNDLYSATPFIHGNSFDPISFSYGALIRGPTSEEDTLEIACSLSFEVEHTVNASSTSNPTRMGAYFGHYTRIPYGSLTGSVRQRTQRDDDELHYYGRSTAYILSPWTSEPAAEDTPTDLGSERILITPLSASSNPSRNFFVWSPRDAPVSYSSPRPIRRRVGNVTESFLVEYSPNADLYSFGFFISRAEQAFSFRPRVSISVLTSRLNRELSPNNYSGVRDNYRALS